MLAMLGLCSIACKDLDVPAFLDFAAEIGAPHVGLRFGPKGYDLAALGAAAPCNMQRRAAVAVDCLMSCLEVGSDSWADHLLVLGVKHYPKLMSDWHCTKLRVLGNQPSAHVVGRLTEVSSIMGGTTQILLEMHCAAHFTDDMLRTLLELTERHPTIGVVVDLDQLAKHYTSARPDMLCALIDAAQDFHIHHNVDDAADPTLRQLFDRVMAKDTKTISFEDWRMPNAAATRGAYAALTATLEARKLTYPRPAVFKGADDEP